MPETSTASRQVMLLILIVGLFAAVWSGDSAHTDSGSRRPKAPARSAVAILMETSAVVERNEPHPSQGGRETDVDGERSIIGLRGEIGLWLVALSCAMDMTECEATSELAVRAPLPRDVEVDAAASRFPVAAPVPATAILDVRSEAAAEPVAAPVPVSLAAAPNDGSEQSAALAALVSSIRIDYRMTCHCCREYGGSAARRMAAVGRRTGRSLSRLTEMVVQAIEETDWSARLSAKPGDGSKQRF